MTRQQAHLSHPKYRPDIDGLRAVAVLAVVAFHAFPTWVRGGFIGVDVFFVISGYLISTIIFENLDRGTFSFSEFYARRIKRIFPALILVLIACLAFGWFALLADEYKQLGKHIAAGAGFVSNIVLWGEAGYFDNSAETKPLLHLWSLGIEEQFYILWPLLLWFAWKRKFNLLTVTMVVAIVSFVLNMNGVKQDAVSTFYSPQTRFWELLCGSLLAWFSLYKKGELTIIKRKIEALTHSIIYKNKQVGDNRTLANVISFTGLIILACGFWGISKELSFPGKWALIPVLGAVLIISAGPKAWFNRVMLSNKVAVWFGLISFPLYLWHWPLLSFARIVESYMPNRNIRIAAVILSVLLSWLTYKFVELPIRDRTKKNTYQTLLLALFMFFIGVLGIISYRGDGYTLRTSLMGSHYSVSGLERLTENDPNSHSKCMQMYGLSGKIRYCSVSTDYKPNIAVIGDSHSAALYKGLSEKLLDEGKGLVNMGGRLFLDVASYPVGSKSEIEIEVYKGGIRATEFVSDEKTIDTVILVSRGSFYLYGDWIFYLISNPTIKDRKQIFEIAMRKTLDRLKGKKQIIFVIENPELSFDPRLCATRPLRFNFSSTFISDCSISRSEYDAQSQEYRAIVNRVLKDYPKVIKFDLPAYLCDTVKCNALINENVLYSDTDHLSLEGARLISTELVKVINGSQSKILAY